MNYVTFAVNHKMLIKLCSLLGGSSSLSLHLKKPFFFSLMFKFTDNLWQSGHNALLMLLPIVCQCVLHETIIISNWLGTLLTFMRHLPILCQYVLLGKLGSWEVKLASISCVFGMWTFRLFLPLNHFSHLGHLGAGLLQLCCPYFF